MSDDITKPNLTRDLPSDHLTEIGRVVVEWAFLEEVVNLGIAGILNRPIEQARLITTPIRNFRQRLTILKEFSKLTIKDDADQENLKRAFKAVETAYGERNKVAHGVWWGLDGPNYPSIRYTKPSAPFEELHTKDIRAIADSIRAASDDLTEFLSGQAPPWPRS